MNNALRILIFLPICYVVIFALYWLLSYPIYLLLIMNLFWFFVLVLCVGGSILAFIMELSSVFIYLTSLICPVKWVGAISISSFSIYKSIMLFWALWSGEDYSGWLLVRCIVITVLVSGFTLGVIIGSILAEMNKVTQKSRY